MAQKVVVHLFTERNVHGNIYFPGMFSKRRKTKLSTFKQNPSYSHIDSCLSFLPTPFQVIYVLMILL